MKILTLTHSFPRWVNDVSGVHVHQFAEQLASCGHQVHILAPHDSDALTTERMGSLYVHRFRYAPAKLATLAYGPGLLMNIRQHPTRWGLLVPFLAAEFFSMVRLVRRYRIDVIHAYGLLFPGLVASMGRPLLRRPIVMTSHGNELFQARGKVQRFLMRRALRFIDICVSNSTATQGELRRITGKDSVTIPMGVDLDRFSPRDNVRGRDAPCVLFVGQLIEKKGVHCLLEAMQGVRSVIPNARLVVAGAGQDRERLVCLSHRLGLNQAVDFVGAMPNESLSEYYRRADVFVLPSIVTQGGDTETLGVVLLEAAASGLPLVASNVGGIPDIVHHDETGLLVEPGDTGQLAQAIIRVLGDTALQERLSTKARQHVLSNFSLNTVVPRFDALLSSLSQER